MRKRDQKYREQPTLFDEVAGAKAKEDGMSMAATGKGEALALARSLAREIAERDGEVTADDVGRLLDARGIVIGPWAGSIFSSGFEFTGKRVRSKRTTNHGRELKVWKLKM